MWAAAAGPLGLKVSFEGESCTGVGVCASSLLGTAKSSRPSKLALSSAGLNWYRGQPLLEERMYSLIDEVHHQDRNSYSQRGLGAEI